MLDELGSQSEPEPKLRAQFPSYEESKFVFRLSSVFIQFISKIQNYSQIVKSYLVSLLLCDEAELVI